MEREGVVDSRCTDCTTFSHLAFAGKVMSVCTPLFQLVETAAYQTEDFLPFGDDNAMREPGSGTWSMPDSLGDET